MKSGTDLHISLIIPVWNRPQEVDELLASLCLQTDQNFEIVIVEDGSTIPCKTIVDQYAGKLDIHYYFKENSGPGQSRNYGAAKASGNYLIFTDSDCVIPQQYIQIVKTALTQNYVDCFGGPDRAHEDFNDLQKAISYAMTSFLTTGGIRGANEKLDKFFPRSFNMGYSREVYEYTQGFSPMRFGEDIDMSIRIKKGGYSTALIKDAYVFHKRRTKFRQFYKQVFNSGVARINLQKRHPGSMKWVHTLPAVFTIGTFISVLLGIAVNPLFFMPVLLFVLLVFLDATVKNKSINVGFLSIAACFCQLTGYGLGFIKAFWNRIVLSKPEFSSFNKNFYK